MTKTMQADAGHCRSILSLVRSSKEGEAYILVPAVMLKEKETMGAFVLGRDRLMWIGCAYVVALFGVVLIVAQADRLPDLGISVLLFGLPAGIYLMAMDIEVGKIGRMSITIIACLFFAAIYKVVEDGSRYLDLFSMVTVMGAVPIWYIANNVNFVMKTKVASMALYGNRIERIMDHQSLPVSVVLSATDEVRVVETAKGSWTHVVTRNGGIRMSMFDYRVCGMDLVDTGITPSEALLTRMRAL